MIEDLTIGGLNIGKPVFLAPMCGVSDVPFRSVVSEFSNTLLFSEMIASHESIRSLKRLKLKTHKTPNRLLAVQLAGCDPKLMAEAAKINEGLGADVIDINFGCPVKKVVKGFAGSAMMKDEDLAFSIMDSVVKAVKIPVTMKTRLGFDENNKNVVSFAQKAQEAGVAMVTIHGRTRSQMFSGKSDWAFVKQVTDVLKIPVIINGDIKTTEDAKEALLQSGANGVMIGRGIYGKPWLISQVVSSLCNQGVVDEPDFNQKLDIINRHLRCIEEWYDGKPVLDFAKKHAVYYTKNIAGSASFRASLNSVTTVDEILNGLNRLFLTAKEQNENK